MTGFLLFHVPLLFSVLYGLVMVRENAFAGPVFSLLLALGGLFAFSIHLFFIKRGRLEFRTPLSLSILAATLILSLLQLSLTLMLLA